MTDSRATEPSPDAPRRARSSPLRASARLAAIVLASIVLVSAFLLRRLLVRDHARRYRIALDWTRRWGRVCCRLAGYDVRMHGRAPPPPVFLTPNHLGYVDIIVIAACVPCFFVAKTEVAQWPLFGFCARVSDHVFVSRRRRKDLRATAEAIRERLGTGASVCAFLEGTSSGGREVLPFRASFLQPAIDAGVAVVPVGIHWRADDTAVEVAEDIAYWKDHVFLPHLWRHLGLHGLHVDVRFGAAIDTVGTERRPLAETARVAVQRLVRDADDPRAAGAADARASG